VQFSAQTPTTEPTEFATPDEVLRSTVQKINSTLATELLGRILAAPPSFFEQVVVKLLLGMGFGGSREQAGRAIGASGDGGLDGVIDQDALGLDRIYLQAKRYSAESPVSEPEVREFSGALSAAKANKGVFVTTSYFTKPAADFVNRIPSTIVLIDAEELTSLMIRYNVGVRDEEVISIKKIDEDFFDTD
jgi:restriction system protein